MNKNALKKLFVCLIIVLTSSNRVYAQFLPPKSLDAGAINKINSELKPDSHFQSSIEESSKTDPLKAPELEGETKKAEVHIEKFKLNKLTFSGNTVLKSGELNKISRDFIDKDVSIDDINKLVGKITTTYQSKGYITCFAYIPEQEIKDGELKISIFEGKVGNINIKGAKWTRKAYIKNNILKANNFEKNKVFNLNNLQKSIVQINNSTYIKGKVTIQKGEEPETTDIILDLKDRFPISLNTGWNNQGRNLIGVQKANIFLTDNNLTGFGDSLYGGVSLAQKTVGINAGYSIPIGPYGTELKFGFSSSSINVGGEYEQLKIHGTSRMYSTTISQPVYKGEKFNLTSNFSFDISQSKTTLLDEITLQDYGLRVFRFGLDGTKEDNRGRWISNIQTSYGFPLCTAERKEELGELSHKFVKFNTNIIRVQSLPFNTIGILRLSSQYSPKNLLSPEQFQIGGMYSVRGYDEGLLIGDIGYNGSLELRRAIPYLPDFSVPYWKNRSLRINLKDKVQLAGFYDNGFARVLDKDSRITYKDFLQGAGVGLRFQLSKYLSANIDLGFPFGRKRSPDQNAVKFHFGLSSDLF